LLKIISGTKPEDLAIIANCACTLKINKNKKNEWWLSFSKFLTYWIVWQILYQTTFAFCSHPTKRILQISFGHSSYEIKSEQKESFTKSCHASKLMICHQKWPFDIRCILPIERKIIVNTYITPLTYRFIKVNCNFCASTLLYFFLLQLHNLVKHRGNLSTTTTMFGGIECKFFHSLEKRNTNKNKHP